MDGTTDIDGTVLHAVLESWDRSNRVLVNLLRALPDGGLTARAAEGSPSVAEMLTHVHHERMVSVLEEAPEFAGVVPREEWQAEPDPDRIAGMLNESHAIVRAAVVGRFEAGRNLDVNFGHPALLISFLIFHESYHHGQIKLALKLSGRPMSNDTAGPITWDVWRRG
jgi:uncharacterized damage-inducible protein DinB